MIEESLIYEDGHYSISIPWKEDTPSLPDNYNMAVKRLQNTEKRLQRDPTLASAYSEVIDQYTKKGYIRRVPKEEHGVNGWLLPHFPVVRTDKETTKVRIVFDASAKHNDISLNDVIYQGPKLQRELFDVLLRFRRNPVAVVCDIAEMYLRVGIVPDDRTYHRFLWRHLDEQRTPDVYEFCRLVFGVNCSPFLAQYVAAQRHAEKYRDTYPLAAETILKSTYMDDSMDSVADETRGVELYNQLSALWEKAGMHARKWLSNSTIVMEHVPQEDRISQINLDEGYLPSMKTLGIQWSANTDEFNFTINSPTESHKLTKRSFLKIVAALFDPLGFLAPFIIRAKVIIQEMWASGFGWDDQVDDAIFRKATKWLKELNDLHNIRIPRCLRNSCVIVSTTLHTMVDASQEAYGAAIYMHHFYITGDTSQRLVASKSRVAPLKAVSITRLELMAAVLGLRLTESVASALDIPVSDVVFWSDSMTVLWWIRGRSRDFKPFVANRVGDIQRERPAQISGDMFQLHSTQPICLQEVYQHLNLVSRRFGGKVPLF